MYFVNIIISQHILPSELENEKTNILLLLYMDSIY